MGWDVMLIGHRTWIFDNKPVIASTGVIGGPFEAQGKIPNDFDILHDDMWLKQSSFEKAQQMMMEEAAQIAVKKMEIEEKQDKYFINVNLINKIITISNADNKNI